MTEVDPIRDLRFEGMDIPHLLEWIRKIKQGGGSGSMHDSVDALQRAVQVVVDLDETLRIELGKLRIAWAGNAGDIAQEATRQQIVTMRDAQDPLKASAAGVQAQGEGYSSARHSLPDESELRHHESENVVEWAGGAFGYESDYDAEAKKISGQKQAAQAALGSYRDTTVAQAEQFRPIPEMAPAAVSAQSASSGGAVNVGAGAAGSGGTQAGGSGAGPVPGTPVSGGFAGPGTDSRGSGGAVRRDGDRGGSAVGGGARGTGGDPNRNPHDDPNPEGVGLGTALGIGAGGAAVAGIGAFAASRMLGGKAGLPEGGAARGGQLGQGGTARGGSSGVGGGPGDTTAGRTASASTTSKPAAGSMMTPAAARGAQQGSEAEHENKYVAPETPFDDNRLAAPAVLGYDPASGEVPTHEDPAAENTAAEDPAPDAAPAEEASPGGADAAPPGAGTAVGRPEPHELKRD